MYTPFVTVAALPLNSAADAANFKASSSRVASEMGKFASDVLLTFSNAIMILLMPPTLPVKPGL